MSRCGLRETAVRLGVYLVSVIWLAAGGCSSESTRLALQTQARVDEVQQAVFDRQHETLCILLYRDLLGRLEAGGVRLSADQRQAVSEVWNDRDLLEFWALQQERARALRLVTVDAKLYSDQSIADLLWKSLSARAGRVRQGLAASVAGQAVLSED